MSIKVYNANAGLRLIRSSQTKYKYIEILLSDFNESVFKDPTV